MKMNVVHIIGLFLMSSSTTCSQKQYWCSDCNMVPYHTCTSIFLSHVSPIILFPCSTSLIVNQVPFSGLLYGYTDLVCHLLYNSRRHIWCISTFGRGLSIACVCVLSIPFLVRKEKFYFLITEEQNIGEMTFIQSFPLHKEFPLNKEETSILK